LRRESRIIDVTDLDAVGLWRWHQANGGVLAGLSLFVGSHLTKTTDEFVQVPWPVDAAWRRGFV
jgi:hypothetical protein